MAKRNNRVKSTNDLELKDRLVAINRVTKVTKGGRAFSFAAIVVVGNEDGVVGWGLGKANEVQAAIALPSRKARPTRTISSRRQSLLSTRCAARRRWPRTVAFPWKKCLTANN